MSLDQLQQYIGNDLPESLTGRYSCIIGASPSKGARSPLLWNRAYSKAGVDAQMIPLDVEPENFATVMALLEKDSNCLGGCVAVPYKEQIHQWLGASKLTEVASDIGAVNNFYRGDNPAEFVGTNTDGEAALQEIMTLLTKDNRSVEDIRQVLILGTGGASKAVTAYIAASFPKSSEIKLMYHSKAINDLTLANREIKTVPWSDLNKEVDQAQLIVNCTILGAHGFEDVSPLSDTQLSDLGGETVIYDINYQPSPSKLIREAAERSLLCSDGLGMNMIQAVLAFINANQSLSDVLDEAFVKKAMQES